MKRINQSTVGTGFQYSAVNSKYTTIAALSLSSPAAKSPIKVLLSTIGTACGMCPCAGQRVLSVLPRVKTGYRLRSNGSRVKTQVINSVELRKCPSLSCVILYQKNLVKSLSFSSTSNWRKAWVITLNTAAMCSLNFRRIAKISGKWLSSISRNSLREGALVLIATRQKLYSTYLSCFSYFAAWCGRYNPVLV